MCHRKGVDSESDSERLSVSPRSVLSDNESNTSDERDQDYVAGPGSLKSIAIVGTGRWLVRSATHVFPGKC